MTQPNLAKLSTAGAGQVGMDPIQKDLLLCCFMWLPAVLVRQTTINQHCSQSTQSQHYCRDTPNPGRATKSTIRATNNASLTCFNILLTTAPLHRPCQILASVGCRLRRAAMLIFVLRSRLLSCTYAAFLGFSAVFLAMPCSALLTCYSALHSVILPLTRVLQRWKAVMLSLWLLLMEEMLHEFYMTACLPPRSPCLTL